MKYKCINNKWYNKRTKNESDYSENFTIGKIYDISEDNDFYDEFGFWLVESDDSIEITMTNEILNNMFISLIDFRNEKIKSILNEI